MQIEIYILWRLHPCQDAFVLQSSRLVKTASIQSDTIRIYNAMSGLGLRGGIRMYRFTLFRFLYVDNAAAESSMGVGRQSRIFTVKFANVDGLQEILERVGRRSMYTSVNGMDLDIKWIRRTIVGCSINWLAN